MKQFNILVVEDSSLTRKIYAKNFILYADYIGIFDEAEDGQQAMAKISEQKYDLVLLDIHMPKANGIRVLQHLREVTPETKVIVCSSANDISTIKRLKELKIDGYLLKPVNLEALNDVILRIFPNMKIK